jgi:2-C-methyl-D-erythritol 4-phosphate cytidylyltransferase
MKKYAVIVAGGTGKRMGNTIPKQFLLLKNKPVLWYTLDTFLRAYSDIKIILVLPEQYIQKGKTIAASLDENNNRIIIVSGGETRFHSVQCGLKEVKEDSVVFVHDAVRCLVSVPLIHRCYKDAVAYGSAIPAVAATDSIRILNHTYHSVADRKQVRIIQTPQTFLSNIILPAFKQQYADAFTDEATAVEASGTKVFLTEGEYDNIKITRPLDMMIAERILEERSALKQS